MNGFAAQHLALMPPDRVLEIGFGGGVNLPFLIQNAAFVVGLDMSRDVVAKRKLITVAIMARRAVSRRRRERSFKLRRSKSLQSIRCISEVA
jgi:cyclopropane fatty-acyl-phospholipid synthase-like methyltransferase